MDACERVIHLAEKHNLHHETWQDIEDAIRAAELAAVLPKAPDPEEIPRCERLDGTSLRIVEKYTEAGQFCEANVVFVTDGVRTAAYVPLAAVRQPEPSSKP